MENKGKLIVATVLILLAVGAWLVLPVHNEARVREITLIEKQSVVIDASGGVFVKIIGYTTTGGSLDFLPDSVIVSVGGDFPGDSEQRRLDKGNSVEFLKGRVILTLVRAYYIYDRGEEKVAADVLIKSQGWNF